jgi:hypothetical protein
MTSPRRRIALIAAPAAMLAGLVLAPSAGALVYCVPSNAVDPACQTPQATLQAALNAANANAGNDTVRLGVGTFTDADSFGFTYFAGDGNVSIIGAGQGQTTLTTPPDPGDMFHVNNVLRLDDSGGGSSVSDLTVSLPTPSNNNMFGSQYRAVEVEQGQIDRLTITAPAIPINSYGFFVDTGPTTIDNSTVMFPAPGGENAVIADGAVQITDSDFTADSPVVIREPAAATHSIDRTSITAVGNTTGVDVEEGTVNLSNSLIDLGTTQAQGVRARGGNAVSEAAIVNLDHVTIVGTDLSAEGVRVEANDNANADSSTANIANSVIHGVGIPIRRIADNMDAANVTTSYSNYNVAANVESNGANGTGMIIFTNQTNFPPGFVGGGNFHLAAGSMLLDIGDPADPPMGALDIDGNARALSSMTATCAGPVAGRRDIGADEFVPGMPAGCNPVLPTPAPTATPTTTPAKKKKCKKRKRRAAAAAKKCKKKRR